MILKNWKISWEVAEIMKDIRIIIQDLNITVTHTFKEGNIITDLLANEIFESQGLKEYHDFRQLPMQSRKLITMDKDQVPHLRIKTRMVVQ